jgi:TatD DNase family protein
LIDFHCHLDLFPNPQEVLEELDARGTYVLAVTTTPKAWRGTRKLVGSRKRVRVALGLHPELVALRHQELPLLFGLLPEARYVGEIGIDGSLPYKDSFDLQKMVFDRILTECARLGGRVMTIHSRGAASAVLDALERRPDAGVPILHWFSGNMKELRRAVQIGCWFSVGPAMLRSRKGRELASAMPIDRILTETDAPFARDGEHPLMPWQAYDALPVMGMLCGIGHKALALQVKKNLKRLAEYVPA